MKVESNYLSQEEYGMYVPYVSLYLYHTIRAFFF